jgi:aminoglycoside phosphotransferase (APT) family kinase protein
MLSAPDVDLVRRDPRLVGLGTLLDPEAFVAALMRAAPGVELGPAEISYIRYKPGTNCLVGYRLEVEGEVVDAHARAFLPADRAPFRKTTARGTTPGAGGQGRIVLEPLMITAWVFPNDDDLRVIARLYRPEARTVLLRKIAPGDPGLWEGSIEHLAYKPQRRYVARLRGRGVAGAVLKCYTKGGYRDAAARSNGFTSVGAVQVARRLGGSDRHRVLVYGWLDGTLLSDLMVQRPPARSATASVGAALAELHAQEPIGLSTLERREEVEVLVAAAEAVGVVCPRLAARAAVLASRLAEHLCSEPIPGRPIHGDFYARQVLLAEPAVAVLDFDRAARGDPATDLGNFCAHLERDALSGRLAMEQVGPAQEALLSGYAENATRPRQAHLAACTAAGLLRLAPEPFRRHEPEWPELMEAILERAERILAPARGGGGEDPALPFLGEALHADGFRRHLMAPLIRGLGARRVRLRSARVVRHKPGSRCLIEYAVDAERAGGTSELVSMLGKIRTRSADRASYALHAALRQRGFDSDSADGVSVPEPVAIIPQLHMWMQRRVPGVPATRLLAGPGRESLARRIAEAAHKLHGAGVPAVRRHGVADELRILEDRLTRVAGMRPEWRSRLQHLLGLGHRVAARLREPAWCGIHRDFYPEQILVDGTRLYLVDLDLYCLGDPALDIGNFSAHLTEQGLRFTGDPDALEDAEAALQRRFVELSGPRSLDAVRAYAALSLARHVFLSTQFPERRRLTEWLLQLSEARLGALAGSGTRAPGARKRRVGT